jgi:hypothetical protein
MATLYLRCEIDDMTITIAITVEKIPNDSGGYKRVTTGIRDIRMICEKILPEESVSAFETKPLAFFLIPISFEVELVN